MARDVLRPTLVNATQVAVVWNRDLPGVAGDVKLSFDLRVNLETGTGFGTASDPIHPDWDIHFAIRGRRADEGA